jgi:ATP-dependent exoDNAse (exonuclease V) alpha subunit
MTQQEALHILKLGHNVYLTGAAGSGKTYLLNQYIDYLKKNSVPIGITASTGIAATHMRGVTIHSWAHIGIKEKLTPADLHAIAGRIDWRMQLLHTRVLIIDEVSMLNHFRLDMVDQVLRTVHENDLPFGGIQVVLCGDLFQLPPVVKNGEPIRYVTDSAVWKHMSIKVCYLTEQHRQNDKDFLALLNEIRDSNISNHSLEKLGSRIDKGIRGKVTPTKLYTHNADVDSINTAELAKLPGEEWIFDMTSHGESALIKTLQDSCLAPRELHLKEGAMVMFVQNNRARGYVNGTLGKVVGFSGEEGYPVVETLRGKQIIALPSSWKIEEGKKTLAEIVQVPIRLAWAITIHKSQGMTLDAAQIDLGRAFIEGMGYVALSRVKSLNGITLLGLNNMALRVNARVIKIDKILRLLSEKNILELKMINTREMRKREKAYLELLMTEL